MSIQILGENDRNENASSEKEAQVDRGKVFFSAGQTISTLSQNKRWKGPSVYDLFF